MKIALGTIAGADDMLDLDYGYGTTANNGNVMSQTISVLSVGSTPGFVATQTYTYDELNRLKSATENSTPTEGSPAQSWKQTYSFDRFGNRRFDTTSGATTTIPGTCSMAVCNPTFDLSNNRFADEQGYDYDDAGNVTQDAEGKKFVYDGDNKQKSFGTGGDDDNGGTYFYDGDGRRVKKSVGPEVTVFIYNAGGQLVAEYATTAPSSPQVNYLTADTLGSPRINTDATGDIIARHDYMPFGEEIFATGNRGVGVHYGGDGIQQQFTGYERDDESGLDFAQSRQYASRLGRFTSPDNFLNDTRGVDPASWNLYVYVRNNPITNLDPTGEKIYVGNLSPEDLAELKKRINFTYGCEDCVDVDDNGYLTVNTDTLTKEVADAAKFLTDAIRSDSRFFAVEVTNNNSDVAFADSGGATVSVPNSKGKKTISAIRIRLDFGDDRHVSGDAETKQAYLFTVFAHEVRHLFPNAAKDPTGNKGARSRGEVVNDLNELLLARGLPLRERYQGIPNPIAPQSVELTFGKAEMHKGLPDQRGRDGIEVKAESRRTLRWLKNNVGGTGVN